MNKIRLSVLMFGLLVGCGSDLTAMDGIYAIRAWNMNDEACEQGPSVLEFRDDHYFFVRDASSPGTDFVTLVMCESVFDCEERLDAGENFYTFQNGSDSRGWTGRWVSQWSDGDVCTGDVQDLVLGKDGPDDVFIEITHTSVAAFPKNREGECDIKAAERAAIDQPCTGFEAVRGEFVQAVE